MQIIVKYQPEESLLGMANHSTSLTELNAEEKI